MMQRQVYHGDVDCRAGGEERESDGGVARGTGGEGEAEGRAEEGGHDRLTATLIKQQQQ